MADENIPPPGNDRGATGAGTHGSGSWLALRAADVLGHRICDDLSGLIIFAMLVFSPWAFGTTQAWSIQTMNVAGYALGVLLLAKLFIRQAKGYRPMRWDSLPGRSGNHPVQPPASMRRLTRTLAGLTLVVLGYCLASAWNAAATYDPDTRLFAYHPHLSWLPHSFDSQRTWRQFWMLLGLAGSFWAVRDWLSGMTADEERAARSASGEKDSGSPARLLPARLRWLIWLICINGALLGVEAIIQRESGSSKLLFLVQPHVNPGGETQFGPYAYRANAAQYFNLIWPLCLGFWWTLHRGGGLRDGRHHLLLPCAVIMAACPIISTSRGGAIVAAGMLALAAIYLVAEVFFTFNRQSPGRQGRGETTLVLTLFFAVVLALGWYFGWEMLAPRMELVGEGFTGREAMFDMARPMARDYPVYGTGPGTFATVFQLYRISSSTYWPEQLHNDWLETLITFGWVGQVLLLAALGCIFLRRFVPGRIRAGRRLAVLAWLALAGCLIHARFDFPFQIHSIVLLFLVICAILFHASGRSSRH